MRYESEVNYCMNKIVMTVNNKDGIGISDFKKIIDTNTFYIDKTYFIKEWCSNTDEVTLITRPRRFGKTLTMSMMEYFFSDKCKDERYLFENLFIANCDDSNKYMSMQGEYPVINISFAGIKKDEFEEAYNLIQKVIASEYKKHIYLLESDMLSEEEKKVFYDICNCKAKQVEVDCSLVTLSSYLEKYTNKKVFIFLDEYDTPLQSAYVNGYWDKLIVFIKVFFEMTFKNNPSLNRAILTGITRVSKESIFSGFNNLTVVTTTSPQYANCFGFTQEEVFDSLDTYGLSDEKEDVKAYYDGFIFGKDITKGRYPSKRYEIYNPWSIVNFLKIPEYDTYWANSSENLLISEVMQRANSDIKEKLEELLKDREVEVVMDEETVFKDLDTNPDALWGLMVASGYLKVCNSKRKGRNKIYTVKITNKETRYLIEKLVTDWFAKHKNIYNEFVVYMLTGKEVKMQASLNKFSKNMFSYFDTGKKPSEQTEPEKFYHGFVLGLLVDLQDRYEVLSNRESGFGRYDVMLKPLDVKKDVGVIIEFKVYDETDEKTLEDTVDNALKQIEEKEYETTLKNANVGKIYKYGIAFEGKTCIIKKG